VRTGLGTWSAKDIGEFLQQGHNRVGSAFGSMTDVINNSTSFFSDADIQAIAVYLASLPARFAQQMVAYDKATTDALLNSPTMPPGATIYASDCTSCHGFDAKGFAAYMPALANNPVVLDENPASLINVVLNGSVPLVARGTPNAYRMPQFRQQLSDQDAADVITFMRNSWGNQAPAVSAMQVAKLRKSTNPTSDQVTVLKMR
jgi:mono/diheme cytochrome c family protein